jgi:hypothetical protein
VYCRCICKEAVLSSEMAISRRIAWQLHLKALLNCIIAWFDAQLLRNISEMTFVPFPPSMQYAPLFRFIKSYPKNCKSGPLLTIRILNFCNNKYSLHFYLPMFENYRRAYNRWSNRVRITGHFSISAHSAQCRWASACALCVFVCTVCSMMRTLGQLPSKMRHFLMLLFSELCPVWG